MSGKEIDSKVLHKAAIDLAFAVADVLDAVAKEMGLQLDALEKIASCPCNSPHVCKKAKELRCVTCIARAALGDERR